MTVIEVARKALDIYKGDGQCQFESPGALAALRGFLQGVIDGKIEVGQAWVAAVFLNKRGYDLPEEIKIIETIFASGMCCDGQDLTGGRAKNFVERA